VERQTFDREYVQRLIAGDLDTEANFAGYFESLLSLKLRMRLRSREMIEDVKQETFLRVIKTLRQRGGLDNPGSLGAYVNSVCNNILFETYRGQAKDPGELPEDLESGEEDAYSSLVSRERTQQVRQVLEELPAKEREILKQLFFEQRDKDEICRSLRVDRGYLRVLIHRAKTRFRDALLKKHESVAND
jgi:RNA polymerase sigma-70 factor (ECF subfamily)